jgi:hypothetical protein
MARTKTDTFHVERSVAIDAAPLAIFPHINDFRRWAAWSPYEQMDPGLAKTYSGAESGKGAIYTWTGKKAGAGRMEIIQSDAATKVVVQLDFTKPMTTHNTAAFTLERRAGGTRVTWSMDGPTTLMSKVMGLFLSMDKLVGGEFEKGLANLKRLAEGVDA